MRRSRLLPVVVLVAGSVGVVACGTDDPAASGSRMDQAGSACPVGAEVSAVEPVRPTTHPGETAPLPAGLEEPQRPDGESWPMAPAPADQARAPAIVGRAEGLEVLARQDEGVRLLRTTYWTGGRGETLGAGVVFEASPPVSVPMTFAKIVTDHESSEVLYDEDGFPRLRQPGPDEADDYRQARAVTVFVSFREDRVVALDASTFDPLNPCDDPIE